MIYSFKILSGEKEFFLIILVLISEVLVVLNDIIKCVFVSFLYYILKIRILNFEEGIWEIYLEVRIV